MTTQQVQQDCPICLTPLAKGAALFTTACGHQFHYACIKDSVAHANFSCPMCRGPMNQLMQTPAARPAAAPVAPQPQPIPVQAPMQMQQQIPPGWVPPPPGAAIYPPAPAQVLRGPAIFRSSARPPVPRAAVYSPTTLAGEIPAEDPLPPPADAPMPATTMTAATGSDGVKLTTTLEASEVLFSSKETIFGMVSVIAPTAAAAATTATGAQESRGGVDIVAVVDRSGSMSGTKIALLKQSLKYMLTQLSSHDRFCIVSFNSSSDYVCGLKRMDSAGTGNVGMLIDTSPALNAQGGTSIWAGLKKGLDVLRARKERNPVCTILLLTDGQDSSALAPAKAAFEGVDAVRIDGLSLHSFGFGSDHDAPVCSGLANLGHGTFSYIESVDQLGPAFATTLGGLLSVAAQELVVTVAPASPGVAIVRAHTQFQSARAGADAVSVTISDLYSGERRDMLFEMSLPAIAEAMSERQAVASVRLSFAPAPSFDRAHPEVREASFQVLRPPKVIDTSRNPEIEVQRLRISTADAMSRAIELANTSKHDQAKAILAGQIAAINGSASAKHPVCASLITDLAECQRRVEPVHYHAGGQAYMQSMQMQSAQQRCVASPSPSAAIYSTPAQMVQQANFLSFASKPPLSRK